VGALAPTTQSCTGLERKAGVLGHRCQHGWHLLQTAVAVAPEWEQTDATGQSMNSSSRSSSSNIIVGEGANVGVYKLFIQYIQCQSSALPANGWKTRDGVDRRSAGVCANNINTTAIAATTPLILLLLQQGAEVLGKLALGH